MKSDAEPLFLKIGLICASLKGAGYLPRARDLLNNCDKGLAMRSAVSLSSFTGNLSGPVDLFGFSAFKMFRTSCSVVEMFSRVGTGVVLAVFGGGCCVSAMFSVDWVAK